MPIRSTCSNCRMQADWPDASRGQPVNCQVCGAAFIVGAPAGPAPQPAFGAAGGNWAAQPAQTRSAAPLIIIGVVVVMLTIVIASGALLYALVKRVTSRGPQPPAPQVQPAFPNTPIPQHRPANPATTQARSERPSSSFRPTESSPPTASPASVPSGAAASGSPSSSQAAVEIVLSDARTNSLGARKGFSVHYKFTRGAPQPGVWLHWVIKAADGKLYSDQLMFSQLSNEGTLGGAAFDGGRGNQEQFEMWIEMGSPSPFAEKTKVSNTITTVTGALPGGGPAQDARRRHEEMMEESRKRLEENRKRMEELRNRQR